MFAVPTGTVAAVALIASVSAAAAAPRTATGRDAATPAAEDQGRRLVYVEVDGITLTRSDATDDAGTNQSVMVDSDTEVIPRLELADLGDHRGLSREQLIDELIRLLYVLHAPYNIDFTATRPTSGAYSMIVIGGDCPTVAGRSCAGIAPRDCGDQNLANIAFVFPRGLSVEAVATLAAHESGHAWGLGHTDDPDDIMNPIVAEPPQTRYGAGNLAGIDGQPDGSGCPQSATYQDSHELLLANIGPRPPDGEAPEVWFEHVVPGRVVRPGQSIVVGARDNVAADRAQLEIADTVVGTASQLPFRIALPTDLPAGELRLTARAFDLSGNTGVAEIGLWVSDQPPRLCATAADCGDGDRCEPSGLCVREGASTDLFTSCADNRDCWTGLCARQSEQSLCTFRCTGDGDCPGDSVCLDGTACWPADAIPDPPSSGGCQSGGAGGPFTGLLLLAAAASLGERRRRQR
jgi:hypothetical protein